jgi:hypothetical protein
MSTTVMVLQAAATCLLLYTAYMVLQPNLKPVSDGSICDAGSDQSLAARHVAFLSGGHTVAVLAYWPTSTQHSTQLPHSV